MDGSQEGEVVSVQPGRVRSRNLSTGPESAPLLFGEPDVEAEVSVQKEEEDSKCVSCMKRMAVVFSKHCRRESRLYAPMPKSVSFRVFLVILGFVHCCLLSGLVFGWVPLELILRRENVLRRHCDMSVSKCRSQDIALGTIFICASVVVNVGQLLTGPFLDYFGPKITFISSVSAVGVGFFVFAFATESFPMFIPAYSLIAIGGVTMQLSILHLSNLFPKWRGLIKACDSGCFNVSSLIFFIFDFLSERFGVIFKWLFLAYLIPIVVVLISGAIAYPWRSFPVVARDSNSDRFLRVRKDDVENDGVVPSSPADSPVPSDDDVVGETDALVLTSPPVDRKRRLLPSKFKKSLLRCCRTRFWLLVFSLDNGLLVAFMSLNILRLNYYIQTMVSQLELRGDSNDVHSSVFSAILPFGFIGIPFIGFILDQLGLAFSFFLVNLMHCAYNALFELENLDMLYFTFCVMAISRPFSYSAKYAYLAEIFGQKVFGSLVGVCNFVIGITSALQFPMLWAIDEFEMNYSDVNLLFLVVGLTLFFFPFFIERRKSQRLEIAEEKKEKEGEEENEYGMTTE